MYQLIVNTNIENPKEPALNRWVDVDLGDATVALTYQANDLAELKSREVNRSNRIKLPRTSTNDRLFKLPSEPLSLTVAPYRYFDCRLYDNGVELFGAGAKLQLMDTTDTTYEVCIKGSLFDFFESIKELSLRSIDTKAYDKAYPGRPIKSVPWKVDTVANTDEDDAVVFPLIDWDVANNANLTYSQPGLPDNDDPNVEVNDENFRIHVKSQYIFPAVKLSALLEAICLAQGYTLELPKEVTYDPKYRKAVVPVCSLNPGEAVLSGIRRQAAIDTSRPALDGMFIIYRKDRFFFFDYRARTPYIVPANGNENDPCLRFNPTRTGTYSFTIRAIPSDSNPSSARLRIQHDVFDTSGSKVVDNKSVDVPLNGDEAYMVYDIEEGGYLRFWVQSDSGEKAELKDFIFTCTEFKPAGAVFPTDAFPVIENLPDITQLDLIKAVCQLFGLVINVNERSRSIQAYTFNDVVRKTTEGDFIDWSGKLDNSGHSATYQWSSYGQRSYLAYAEDEGREGEKLLDRACFTVDNATLPAEKTLFELPFATCEEVTVCGHTMAKIRMVEGGDNSPDSITEPKPKLLYVEKKDDVRVRFLNPEDKRGYKNQKVAILALFNPLSAEYFVDHYYKMLSGRLLKRARVLKEKIRFTPLDIQRFTHETPVFLSKYSCCFYVNKINNYQPNKLTEVELVAILPEA